VAEFGRREDALKQKEKELQNIKDREIQEKMDSLNSRELSFSSKHANDADKLIKWQQELEQSSQEIHTQHARLDEDRFKIEEQLLKR
jgi:peptidoglycan hydrolase CwlO-like protein